MKYYHKDGTIMASDLDLDLEPATKEEYEQSLLPTIQDQIVALENTITARNIRNAIQGDEYALNKINEVEAQIQQLREQLDK